jgi:hypothetical protein
VLLAVLQEAAEEAEPNQTAFFICAGALFVFACVLSLVGTRSHKTFPRSRSLSAALMLVCAVLVGATMFTAVFTA